MSPIDTISEAKQTVNFTLCNKRVYVAGHRGMAGSALVRRLQHEDCTILRADRTSVDLTNQCQVNTWFEENRPQVVFVAAAKVGGIVANNTFRAEFLYDNLMIATNIIQAAHLYGVEKLLFLGSSCIYPKFAPQPMAETMLLTGSLEPTNEPYAIAKIAGLKLVENYRRQYGSDFISVMPTNLYGPGDNFHPEHSHVVAALIRRLHEAKLSGASTVTIWGSGTPRREFLYVDDLADACVHLIKRYSGSIPLNIGTGHDITIKELATLIAETIGYKGSFEFDTSKPDGSPQKLLDVSLTQNLGWTANVSLQEGLPQAYQHFLSTLSDKALRHGNAS